MYANASKLVLRIRLPATLFKNMFVCYSLSLSLHDLPKMSLAPLFSLQTPLASISPLSQMSGTLISVSYFFLRSFCWKAVAQFDCKQLPYQSPLWFFISAPYCLIGCYLLVYYVECAVNYKYAYQVYVIILGRNIDFIQVYVSSTFFRVERGSKDHF